MKMFGSVKAKMCGRKATHSEVGYGPKTPPCFGQSSLSELTQLLCSHSTKTRHPPNLTSSFSHFPHLTSASSKRRPQPSRRAVVTASHSSVTHIMPRHVSHRPADATSAGAPTQTITESAPRESGGRHIGTLRLRGEPRQRRGVRWAADVVDNSNMGKKKSKGAAPTILASHKLC